MGLDLYFNKVKREEVGYFRKVNFLVSFFGEMIGRDVENLEPINVSKEMCEELLDRCNKVLENKDNESVAEELLPVCPGFFFGNYEYNEYYYDAVNNVKNFLESDLIPMFNTLKDGEYIEFQIWY